jgi:hypothetical protein
MRRSLIASAILHVGLLALLLFDFHFGGRELAAPAGFTVDIVQEPSRVQATPAPPAAAAPQPKRDAMAVNPDTRTSEARTAAPAAKAEPAPPPPAPEAAPAKSAEPEPARIAAAPTPRPAEVAPKEPEPAPTAVARPAEPEPAPQPSVTAAAEPPPRPEPAPEPTPKPPEPARAKEPPAKPVAEAKPAPARQAPAKPVAEAKPAPAKETPAKPVAKPAAPPPPKEVAAREAPTPAPAAEKPKAEPEPKPEEDSFAALLKSVENLPKRAEAAEQRSGEGRAGVLGTLRVGEAEPRAGGADSDALVAAARRQMEACWRIPAGTQGVEAISAFDVNVSFNPDGTARSVEVADSARLQADPVFRAVAESAERAAWSCKLALPADSYSLWRAMTFVFDPKQAVTG